MRGSIFTVLTVSLALFEGLPLPPSLAGRAQPKRWSPWGQAREGGSARAAAEPGTPLSRRHGACLASPTCSHTSRGPPPSPCIDAGLLGARPRAVAPRLCACRPRHAKRDGALPPVRGGAWLSSWLRRLASPLRFHLGLPLDSALSAPPRPPINAACGATSRRPRPRRRAPRSARAPAGWSTPTARASRWGPTSSSRRAVLE